MRYLLILVALLMVGCKTGAEIVGEDHDTSVSVNPERHHPNDHPEWTRVSKWGWLREYTTSDGTPCVLYYGEKGHGISCGWRQ